MRKRYRRKRRCCGICKPGKRGVCIRWTERELHALKRFERERRRYV
jgi:hypothetical protein